MHTNSFINSVQGGSRQRTPEVGMGATILFWTDRQAATIIAVSKSGKSIDVQDDTVKRVDSNGMSDAQTWEATPNPNGPVTTFTQRKNGSWVRKGESLKGGQRVAIGFRDHHHDFSF